MIYNRIPIKFGGIRRIQGPDINYQYDVRQVLVISGIDLPDYYEVDFCNEGDSTTITMVGTAEGVEIPDDFLLTGKKVKAYIVVTGIDDGAVETRYEITLPVRKRPTRTDIQPTPAAQLQIDTLVDAMNDAVDASEAAQIAAETAQGLAEDAQQAAEAAQGYAETAQGLAEAAQAAAETAERNAAYSAAYAAQYEADAASSAQQAAQSAAEALASETAAEDAADRAEQGAANAGYMFFYIDEHGDLIYQRTSNVQVDFYLLDGDLYVKAVA